MYCTHHLIDAYKEQLQKKLFPISPPADDHAGWLLMRALSFQFSSNTQFQTWWGETLGHMQDENSEKQNKTKMDYLWKFRRIKFRFAVTFPAATVVNLYRSWLEKNDDTQRFWEFCNQHLEKISSEVLSWCAPPRKCWESESPRLPEGFQVAISILWQPGQNSLWHNSKRS